MLVGVKSEKARVWLGVNPGFSAFSYCLSSFTSSGPDGNRARGA